MKLWCFNRSYEKKYPMLSIWASWYWSFDTVNSGGENGREKQFCPVFSNFSIMKLLMFACLIFIEIKTKNKSKMKMKIQWYCLSCVDVTYHRGLVYRCLLWNAYWQLTAVCINYIRYLLFLKVIVDNLEYRYRVA